MQIGIPDELLSTFIYRVLLLLALFASCESTQKAPLVLYESPQGLVVLKAVRVDFAEDG